MFERDEGSGKSLLSTIITVDGLILSLGWGLFKWDLPEDVKSTCLCNLKWVSTFLAISVISGILSFQ